MPKTAGKLARYAFLVINFGGFTAWAAADHNPKISSALIAGKAIGVNKIGPFGPTDPNSTQIKTPLGELGAAAQAPMADALASPLPAVPDQFSKAQTGAAPADAAAKSLPAADFSAYQPERLAQMPASDVRATGEQLMDTVVGIPNGALPHADPFKLGTAVIRKLTGESASFTDAPVMPVYKIEFYPNGQKWGDVIMVNVTGCNMDCAHCFVKKEYLRAMMDSSISEKAVQGLPRELKGKRLPTADDIYHDIKAHRLAGKRKNLKFIEFNGGEPTLYRGALLRFAQLAKADGLKIAVNTNGLLIAELADYISAFDGYQDTIEFFISLKGTTPAEFARHSGVDGKHYMSPIIAYRKLTGMGFKVYAGVILDNLATEEELTQDDNPVTRLLGWGIPTAMIIWDKITSQIRGHRFSDADRKMTQRGWWMKVPDGRIINLTLPSLRAVRRYLERLGIDLRSRGTTGLKNRKTGIR